MPNPGPATNVQEHPIGGGGSRPSMMASICGTAIGPSFVALEQLLTTLLTERQDVWRA